MNQEHEFYMFVYGMSEDDAMFTEFMLTLYNTYQCSPYDINIAFDDCDEDKEAFMINYAELFDDNEAASNAYDLFVPIQRFIKEAEETNALSCELRWHMWEMIHNKIHWSKVKLEIMEAD
ncbi:TPA: hypothetical protein ACV5RJ_002662 [Enterobacter roggenkampii]